VRWRVASRVLGERLLHAEALLERGDAVAGLLAVVTEGHVEGEALIQLEGLAQAVEVGLGGEQAGPLGADLVATSRLGELLQEPGVERGCAGGVAGAGLRVGGDDQRRAGAAAAVSGLGERADGREGLRRIAAVEPGLGLQEAQAVLHAGEAGGAAGLGEADGRVAGALQAEVLEATQPLGGAAIVDPEIGPGEQLVEEGDGARVVLALTGEDRVAAGAVGEPQQPAGLGGCLGRRIGVGPRGLGGRGVQRWSRVTAAGRERERGQGEGGESRADAARTAI
jgi:hypothetical protein